MAVEAQKSQTTRMDVMPIAKFAKKYLNKTLTDHQMKWFNHIHFGGDRVLMLGPRGHGKTTLDWIYLLWRICHDPSLQILVVSNTLPLASAIMKKVQMHIKGKRSKQLREDFNISPASPWQFGIAYLEGGEDPVLQAMPTVGQMVGWRYDIVVFDDLITVKNIATEDLLNKVDDWVHGSVLPALNPKKEKAIFIGTRKGTRDFYHSLLGNPNYNCLVDKAIKEDGTPLWPEHFTIEKLVKRRQEKPLFFAREYQNDPQIKKGMTLQRKWLKIFEVTPDPCHLNTFIGVDPGLGSSSRASYFAIVVVQVDKRNGNAYVVEIFRERYSAIVVQRKKVLELYEKWAPVERVYVESVFAYKYFADDIHMHIPNVQPIDYVHDKLAGEAVQKKEDRIQIKLGPLFEKGQIWIRDPEHDYFTGQFVEEEYIAFPKGATDMLDALVMACNSLYQEPITLENLGIYAG